MDDNQLIERIAQLWFSQGEDAETFGECSERIKGRIHELGEDPPHIYNPELEKLEKDD